ncbi:lysozyme [Aurantiacibacter poecillastricola]|uniref:lysozyme n=1 Tax=Aurantiacibacter poecillastricola TaxID=3064385 RepID=UPI00273FBAD1|nr:lysozyme [Aurantiacibacter sp. 219JJ12-13]MDP5262855.1 lysozyme [Aurantiacibacter sp. 219JJ12-13]
MTRKPLFDTVRRILGRGFTQAEVDAIDAAADNLPQDCVPGVPGSAALRTVGPEGIALIKRFEGCAKIRRDAQVEAYPDPGTGGDPWTIGWGATGPGIGPGTVWTQDACDARLEADLERYAAQVANALDLAPTTQFQFDALVSFHYNTGAIARATLTRKHKAGDHAGAAEEFARWCHAGGRVMKGLVRRRAAEAALYRKRNT